MENENKVFRVTPTAKLDPEQERYDEEFRAHKRAEAAGFSAPAAPIPGEIEVEHVEDEELADQFERETSSADARRLLSGEAALVQRSAMEGYTIPAGYRRGMPLYPHPDVEGPEDDEGPVAKDDEEDHTVSKNLHYLADLFEGRYRMYGDNYKRFGPIFKALFPDGRIVIDDEVDFTRLGLFVQIVYKLSRYASCFNTGGHRDSLDDLAVYAQMLAELDEI